VPAQLYSYDAARKRLWDELVLVNDQWQQYLKLFGTSPETVNLLNRHARWFFATVQRGLVHEVILGISRLSDPPRTGKRTNLVISELLQDPKLQDKAELATVLEQRISEVRRRAEPVRKHRNTYIAHLDHATALGPRGELLPSVPRQLVTELLNEMSEIYRLHGVRLYETDYAFELSALGSAEAILRSLEGADSWRQHEQAERRRRYGLPPTDDGAA
jgi:hypothetical protein